MTIHNFEQGTEEWHAVRLGKFTATDGQALAANGKGLETLCFEKVAERLTGKAKEHYTNADMERGKEQENIARSSYELETGNLVKQVGFVEASPDVGCSPDGFVDIDGLVEFKCKNNVNHLMFLYDGGLDKSHYWQMQFQMWVTDREWCDYVLYNENFDRALVITRVARNDTDIALLEEGVAKGIARINQILDKVSSIN